MNKDDVTVDRTGYDHDDPSLIAGPGGLTVWDLKQMAQEKRFSELDNLFDNGLTMNALPVGLAAGTPFPVLAGENKLIAEWLDFFTEKNWRGKIYFSSTNKRVSQGRNRVRKSFVLPNSPFVPSSNLLRCYWTAILWRREQNRIS